MRKSQHGQVCEPCAEQDANHNSGCCPAVSNGYEPVKPPTEQVAHSNGQAKIKQEPTYNHSLQTYLPALVYITIPIEASCATASSSVANRDFVPTIPKKRNVCSGELNCEPPVGVPVRGQLRLPYFRPCLKRTASCLKANADDHMASQ